MSIAIECMRSAGQNWIQTILLAVSEHTTISSHDNILTSCRSSSDPFLVSTSVSNRPQLSPTAASFTPIGIADSASANRAHFMAKDLSTSNISFLAANSNAEPCAPGARPANRIERPLPAYGPIGSDRNLRDCLPLSPVRGKPEPEGYSRALLIENVPTNLTYMSLAAFFNVSFEIASSKD
jgi:hypothetical protein